VQPPQDQDDRAQRAEIRIGVAGWDYADWRGPVYPAGTGSRFDRLAYISRFVDVIEINSTFYRPASPRVAESWVRRTRDRAGFSFTAKAHRSWTHETPRELDRAVADTLAGLEPIREAGRLGALLIQFPQSFHFGQDARQRVERLLERTEGWPLVAEVRHASWSDADAEGWFGQHALGWCLVDQPIAGATTIGPLPRVTAPLAYARLHGRNVADWFRPDAGRDARYNYLYTPAQLGELAVRLNEMASSAQKLFVVQNNHFRGQALVNTLQLKRMLQGERPPAPEELVEAYPELAPEVEVKRRRLF